MSKKSHGISEERFWRVVYCWFDRQTEEQVGVSEFVICSSNPLMVMSAALTYLRGIRTPDVEKVRLVHTHIEEILA